MNEKEITDYIFLDDPNPKGDIAFVFGTWNAHKESVQKAVDLYKSGLVPKIIFSGGLNPKYSVIEAPAMALEAIGLGVPKGGILIEDKSTNTLENVVFSLKVIEKEIGLDNIKTIVAVVKNYHVRRVLMTLRKHVPPCIKLKVSTYCSEHYPFTKENWTESELGRKKVFEEKEKIKKYLEEGDLAEL